MEVYLHFKREQQKFADSNDASRVPGLLLLLPGKRRVQKLLPKMIATKKSKAELKKLLYPNTVSVIKFGLEYLVTILPKSIPANIISDAPKAIAKNIALSPSVNPPKL